MNWDQLVNKVLILCQKNWELSLHEYIEEMHGMAQGANISFKDVACFFMSFEVNSMMDCFGIVAIEDATMDKELIHVRSFDQQSSVIDPESGKKMVENSVLIVRVFAFPCFDVPLIRLFFVPFQV